MKTTKKTVWLGAALLALAGVAQAAVGPTSQLSIEVSITASKSVSVIGVVSSSVTANWDGTLSTLVAQSTVMVRNDSHVVTEKWQLKTTARSYDSVSGALGWNIQASSAVGSEQVAVQAVFGSSNSASGAGVCAALTGTTWNNSTMAPPLTTAGQQYTDTTLGSSELNAAGGSFIPDTGTGAASSMYGDSTPNGGVRALCWRLVMPTSTALTGTQVVPIIVTAL